MDALQEAITRARITPKPHPLNEHIRHLTARLEDVQRQLREACQHAADLAHENQSLLVQVHELSESGVSLKLVREVVCAHYKVSPLDLLSERRTTAVVWPRQVAMYLAKMHTTLSLPDIGRRVGGRDHTTVLHAVRKIEAMRADDPDLDAELKQIEQKLLVRRADAA